LERAVHFSRDGVLEFEALEFDDVQVEAPPPISMTAPPRSVRPPSAPASAEDTWTRLRLREETRSVEKQYVTDPLTRTQGTQTEAASLLGISRRALITMIERHGIPRPRKRT